MIGNPGRVNLHGLERFLRPREAGTAPRTGFAELVERPAEQVPDASVLRLSLFSLLLIGEREDS